jgi:redox-sensitive bicupin YhaK (pirin superfamily)
MGNGSTIGRGEMQRMSAGTGVQHSEFNASKTEPVRFLQIWIMPDGRGHTPSYGQVRVGDEALSSGWTRVASGEESAGAMRIHNDVDVFVAAPEAGATLRHGIRPGRGVWLQVVRGTVATFDERLAEGDGMAVEGEDGIAITAVGGGAEVLLLDCS